MRKLTRTAAVAVAALTALALAAAATAAYTTPKLSVSYATGNVTRVVASAAVTDDATARAAIVIPNGTTITAAGPRLDGRHGQGASERARPRRSAPAAHRQHHRRAPRRRPGGIADGVHRHGRAAGDAAARAAGGRPDDQPAGVHHADTSGVRDARSDAACLLPRSPDIPPPNGATFGAKFLSADMTLNGVFSPVAQGAWVGTWLPWNPGVGTINGAAQVLSPASIAPGGITLTGRKVRSVKRLSGRVTQGGAGVATRVAILAGTRRIGSVAATANGNFTFAVPRGVQGDVLPRAGDRRRARRPDNLRPVRHARDPVRQPDDQRFHRDLGDGPGSLSPSWLRAPSGARSH